MLHARTLHTKAPSNTQAQDAFRSKTELKHHTGSYGAPARNTREAGCLGGNTAWVLVVLVLLPCASTRGVIIYDKVGFTVLLLSLALYA